MVAPGRPGDRRIHDQHRALWRCVVSVSRTTRALSACQAALLAKIYTHRIVATGQLHAWLDPNHETNDGRTMHKNLAAI